MNTTQQCAYDSVNLFGQLERVKRAAAAKSHLSIAASLMEFTTRLRGFEICTGQPVNSAPLVQAINEAIEHRYEGVVANMDEMGRNIAEVVGKLQKMTV